MYIQLHATVVTHAQWICLISMPKAQVPHHTYMATQLIPNTAYC